MFDLLVIGAGPGGYTAAARAAKLGLSTAIVEERSWGGTCLNRGCVPTKTLLHASEVYRSAADGAAIGIHAEGLRADIPEIFAYKERISRQLCGGVESLLKGAGVTLLRGRAVITAPENVRVTGESGGEPRYVASPDINTEDFSAAVDFLSTRDDVDPERIGILGICGWGGLALNAAAIDTRIKATVTATMYDMHRVKANGYFDSMDADARYELRRQLNAQRTEDAKNGTYALAGGVVDPLPDDAPQFVKDYHTYYKTPRGYHPRSLNSNNGWNKTSDLSYINTPILTYSDEIRSAVLVIHGEKAHSRYFSEDAFRKLKGDNKELLIIPGASHVDLYDNLTLIPFDKIERFFREYLK